MAKFRWLSSAVLFAALLPACSTCCPVEPPCGGCPPPSMGLLGMLPTPPAPTTTTSGPCLDAVWPDATSLNRLNQIIQNARRWQVWAQKPQNARLCGTTCLSGWIAVEQAAFDCRDNSATWGHSQSYGPHLLYSCAKLAGDISDAHARSTFNDTGIGKDDHDFCLRELNHEDSTQTCR